jgi:hypothetical protein
MSANGHKMTERAAKIMLGVEEEDEEEIELHARSPSRRLRSRRSSGLG